MKVLLIALLALTSAAAEAASLEETYLTSRNQYIEKLARLEKSGGAGDKLAKQEELALNDLEKQLRNIIGEITIDGFSNQGKINLASLTSGDQGFGQLDGLSVSSQDGKAQVVITTDALLRAWLRGHKNWWRKDSTSPPNVPSRIEDALNSESFYTQALSTDAAVVKYANVPISKPAEATFAIAMLNARTQDIGPSAPDEMIVALIKGRKVYVATEPLKVKINPIPVCEKILKKAKSGEDSSGSRDKADAEARKCFSQHAAKESFFPAVTQQAQSLVDRLASK